MKAVKFTSSDGKEQTFSLDYLVEHDAMLVTDVNDAPIAESFGGMNQLWIQGCSAKYFLRDVVSIQTIDIDFVEDPSFAPQGNQHQNRPNIAAFLLGEKKLSYRCGETICVEGWADDYDKAIVAIRFRIDESSAYTEMATPEATVGRLTNWKFSYAAKTPGRHCLEVRAVNEDGKASPIAALVNYMVE